LVIDANDPERVGLTLIVDANRRYGPAADDFAIPESLLGTFEVSRREFVDDLEDPLTEFRSCRRISLGELLDHRCEVFFRFWREVDRHRRRTLSIV